jgi:probable F420-dependent oxidoreductase
MADVSNPSNRRLRVGVQLRPQHTTVDQLRASWRRADEMGFDSIWVWDHFFPLSGDSDGSHFECYTLLAAMAVETSRAQLGALVTCNSYRNPQLLADMSRTIDHLSGGRFVLGIGSGWFARDHDEYGYEFGTAIGRLRSLEKALPLIRDRLAELNPGPVNGHLPILIGGSGEQVTLRLVAEHADAHNTFGPLDRFAHKMEVLDRWCAELGRDPREVERTVALEPHLVDELDGYIEAGADHVIFEVAAGFDFTRLEPALARR